MPVKWSLRVCACRITHIIIIIPFSQLHFRYKEHWIGWSQPVNCVKIRQHVALLSGTTVHSLCSALIADGFFWPMLLSEFYIFIRIYLCKSNQIFVPYVSLFFCQHFLPKMRDKRSLLIADCLLCMGTRLLNTELRIAMENLNELLSKYSLGSDTLLQK